MKNITDLCTGCRACEQLCSKKAISMIESQDGFLTAVINQNLCIDCGLCKKRCPQNADVVKVSAKKVFAARLKDDKILYKSASGGAFAGIAKAWIEEGCVVFGVAYDKDWNAKHICAASLAELEPILSSKYVQADTYQSYKEIKQYLNEGKKVLFSGTGCQIGGLKAFLKKDYANLLTVDLICHGVASPLLFKKYIEWLGFQSGSPILEYDFRDKRNGWGLGYKYKCEGDGCGNSQTGLGYKYKSCTVDPYYLRFLQGHTYRESCFQCHYCKTERAGDITIGDYWGIEKEHPAFFNTKGVSCVLVNTDKGEEAWNRYGDLFHTLESSFDQVARHNGNLLHPTVRNNRVRDHIYDGIREPGWFGNVFAASFHPSWKAKMKNLVPSWVKCWIKKI